MREVARLRREDFADIQAHVDHANSIFVDQGLRLGASGDMDAFAAFIGSQENSWGASASHNPAHSYLIPTNAFWLYLEEADGTKIASITQKCTRTESFIEDIFSHTLYDTQKPILDARLPEFHDGAEEGGLHLCGQRHLCQRIVYPPGLSRPGAYRSGPNFTQHRAAAFQGGLAGRNPATDGDEPLSRAGAAAIRPLQTLSQEHAL